MNLTRLFRTATFRLSLTYALVFLTSVCLLGGLTYFTVRGALERQVERNVRAEVALLTAAYRAGGLDRLRAMVEDPRRGHAWRFHYRVVSPDGAAVLHTVTTASSGAWTNWQSPSPKPSRAGIKALTVALDDKHKLSVASSAAILRDLEAVLIDVLGASLLVALLLGLGGGYWISSRHLARVDSISAAAQSIISGDLKQRIPVRATNDELDRLAMTLNAMLDRIDVLMESLRQVSNDIAHDLRTPLSRLRHRLDRVLLAEDPAPSTRDELEAAVAETDAILDTFGALLRIAQIEAGTRRSGFSELDLGEIVANVCEAYAPALHDEGKRLNVDVGEGGGLDGDRDLLMQLVANLVENGIRHTPAGTVVGIGLRQQQDALVLSYCDNGPGVPRDQRDKILDRFYRADQSRHTQGSGLGLSLVKAVADLHGATVDVADNNPGLAIAIRFPNSH